MNMPNGHYQDTMLHTLCREGYVDGVAFLCDKRNALGNARRVGIKFDAKNLDGRVPLQVCTRACVMHLCTHGYFCTP